MLYIDFDGNILDYITIEDNIINNTMDYSIPVEYKLYKNSKFGLV